MTDKKGDFAFKSNDTFGSFHEMIYGGALTFRSEERRVGKGCRFRWSAVH